MCPLWYPRGPPFRGDPPWETPWRVVVVCHEVPASMRSRRCEAGHARRKRWRWVQVARGMALWPHLRRRRRRCAGERVDRVLRDAAMAVMFRPWRLRSGMCTSLRVPWAVVALTRVRPEADGSMPSDAAMRDTSPALHGAAPGSALGSLVGLLALGGNSATRLAFVYDLCTTIKCLVTASLMHHVTYI